MLGFIGIFCVVLYIVAGVIVATIYDELYERTFETRAELENLIGTMFVWPLAYLLILIIESVPDDSL